MYEKTEKIDGVEFKLAAITVEQADEIYAPEVEGATTNKVNTLRQIVVATLNNGGADPQWTVESIGKMPYARYVKLQDAVMQVNEMVPKKGEAQAETQAASTA